MACGDNGAITVSAAIACAIGASLIVAAPAISQTVIHLSKPDVELGQLIDLSRVSEPLRDRAAKLIVIRFRSDQRAMTVEGRRLTERAAAMMPALAGRLPSDPPASERLVRDGGEPKQRPATCMKVLAPVEAESIPIQEDFAPSDCGGASQDRPLRYEARSGFVRALRTLTPGEVLGQVPQDALSTVSRGQRLYVEARVGPVVVQRAVTSVQSARRGEGLFVADRDGRIFPAPMLQGKP